MNLTTCLKKMELVGVLAFATVDHNGAPQIRNISAIHYEPDALYFFTARGKNFCRELEEDGRVQILCYTKYKEMIRLSGRFDPAQEGFPMLWSAASAEMNVRGASLEVKISPMSIPATPVISASSFASIREMSNTLISVSILFSARFILWEMLQYRKRDM